MLANEKEAWNGLKLLKSQLYIAINWFNDSVQDGIFVSEHEGGTKMNKNLLNRQLITCIIRLENIL